MHLAFPFRIEHGRPASADDDAYVRELIAQVLFTSPGERVNRPDFGCGADRLVFSPDDSRRAATVRYLVESELQRALADVARIESVTAAPDGARLTVKVSYVNLLTGSAAVVELPS